MMTDLYINCKGTLPIFALDKKLKCLRRSKMGEVRIKAKFRNIIDEYRFEQKELEKVPGLS
jgi:hypothetical protein